MLDENIKKIEYHVEAACSLAHRSPKDVQVIAVTKTVDSLTARKLVDFGITHLGENRVEKMLEKQTSLADHPEICWHLIGNLQRRKVKQIINQIDYFHALDSLSLANEIQKRAEKQIKCFIEVNVSGEESKHGLNLEEVMPFIKEIANWDKILIVGLMTMAPYAAPAAEIQRYFSKLKEKQREIAALNLACAPCQELSMGMSQDYELAIKEGATFVRIGTAFFSESDT